MVLVSVYFIILFICLLSLFPPVLFFRCVSRSLSLPLSSCLGCIPPLIGLPFLRSLLRSVLVYVIAFCLFLLFVLLFVLFVFLVDLFLFCLFCVPFWRRCPLLTTFFSCPFSSVCFLALLFSFFFFFSFSEIVPGLI